MRAVVEALDRQMMRVDPRDVVVGMLVHRSVTGVVHQGTYRGQQVAVKQLLEVFFSRSWRWTVVVC